MTEFLLLVLLLLVTAVLVNALVSREKLFEFETLFHVSLVAFLGRQIIYTYNQGEDMVLILLYMVLCSIAIILGGKVKLKLLGFNSLVNLYSTRYRLFNSYVLCIISLLAYTALSTSSSAMESQMWTGLDTVYNFFFIVYRLGFIISILGYYKTRKKVYLIPLFLCGLIFMDKIFINGKRTDFVYLILIIFLARYFIFNKLPSYLSYLAGVGLAPFVLVLLVALRTVTLDGAGFRTFRSFSSQIDIEDIKQEFWELRENSDLVSVEFDAARHSIEQVWNKKMYTFGGNYWNDIVQDFVPSILVGSENKSRLFLPIRELEKGYGGYYILKGSTLTGYYDTFRSFSLFGCVIWFWFSALAKAIFEKARAGSEAYSYMYMALIVEFLHALTHRSSLLFTGMIFVIIYSIFLKSLNSIRLV